MQTPDPESGASDRDWSACDEARLRALADDCLPVAMIALKFDCSEAAVYAKAAELGIGVAPNYALGCERRAAGAASTPYRSSTSAMP